MRAPTIYAGLLTVAFAVSLAAQSSSPTPEPGRKACANCHAAIYKSYKNTAMARASGFAKNGLIAGDFLHSTSGVRYRVFERGGRIWLSYERDSEPGLHGQRELLYFIGSDKKGRSYLFPVQGFLFESPINWYAQETRWNMAPAYLDAREIPLNLPSLVDCLNCHVSGLQIPVAGTENRFSGRPFLHHGITCERCHGVGEGHLEGNGPIVNPAKLPPERRDSICMECHFEGTVAVKQPNRQLTQFKPGDLLADYVHYFLLRGEGSDTGQAVSQFEALSLSACKRKSGNSMSCTSCHDPHSEPAASERATYYRGKCLACHGEPFGEKHHPDKVDCTECHMASLPSKDVSHTQGVDHRILRYPAALQPEIASGAPRLVPFPSNEAQTATTRDLALAWEQLAHRNTEGAARQAEHYLRKAVKQTPDDTALLTALGFQEQQHGHDKKAQELYERTLHLDPLANEAAKNLGVLEARAGHWKQAVTLWQGAFERLPHESVIGMDLARAFCASGQTDVARQYVERVLEFNPDFGAAKRFSAGLNASSPRCVP